MKLDGDLVATIQKECQPFLSLLRDASGALMRGVSASDKGYFTRDVRRDRRPKNMPEHLHLAADAWFSERFGVRYRGAGLFCTGDAAQAATHGRTSLIFPIGGFQFCWSPHVRDLHEWFTASRGERWTRDEFVRRLVVLDYAEDDLAGAIASGNEVMVACARYYAVQLHDEIERRAFLESIWV